MRRAWSVHLDVRQGAPQLLYIELLDYGLLGQSEVERVVPQDLQDDRMLARYLIEIEEVVVRIVIQELVPR